MQIGDILWRKVWTTFANGRLVSEKKVVVSKLTPKFVYVMIPGAVAPIEPKFHRSDTFPLRANRTQKDYLSQYRYTLENLPNDT